jgi:hypothetical protein
MTEVEAGINVEMPLSETFILLLQSLPDLVKEKWKKHGTFHYGPGPICLFDKIQYKECWTSTSKIDGRTIVFREGWVKIGTDRREGKSITVS